MFRHRSLRRLAGCGVTVVGLVAVALGWYVLSMSVPPDQTEGFARLGMFYSLGLVALCLSLLIILIGSAISGPPPPREE